MVQLDLGNLCSELGEAYRDYASLTYKKQHKVDDYSKSIEWYLSALQEGKEPSGFISHLGFSWFKLGQFISEVDSLSEMRNMVKWVGVSLENKDEEEIKKEFATRCFENAFFSSSMARTSYDDSSRELYSKLGNIAFELAQREHELGNIRQMEDYILIARENLEESMKQQFPFAYVLRAQLSDFIKEKISTESNENPEKCKELEEIAKCGWRDCIPKIFNLINDDNNKAELIRYNKGSSVVYELVDENFPLRHAFIVKEFKDKEAEKEFLITRYLFKALRGKVRFSRPLNILPHDGKYYLVIERSPAKDLERTFEYKTNIEKIEAIESALKSLTEFHQITTTEFSKKRYILEDRVNDEPVTYKIEHFDYLENFIEKMFLGRGYGEKVKQLAKIIKENKKNDFDLLNKEEFFVRLPHNEHLWDLLLAYNNFLNRHLTFDSKDLLLKVLHCDAHPGNYLDNAQWIDPRNIKIGDPLYDFAYLLEKPPLRGFLASLNGNLLGSLTGIITSEKRYFPNALHVNICRVGSWLPRKKINDAKSYYKRSLDLIELLNESSLRQALEQYIQHLPPTKLKIGIDIDGVIADSSLPKIKYAEERYDLNLLPEDCSLENFIKKGIDPEIYLDIRQKVYSTERSLESKPIPEAVKIINRLKQSGHKIYIITGRPDESEELTVKWLAEQGVAYDDILFVSGKDKKPSCENLKIDLLIDDKHNHLEKLSENMIPLLFSNPTNKDTPAKHPQIIRVNGWKEIEEQIRNNYLWSSSLI